MNPESTVCELVVERPARARVFEKFGIDYCCGGKKPLLAACRDRGVDAAQVLVALEIVDTVTSARPEVDWSRATLTQLADHIEQTHHVYMKAELPRLEQIIVRVVSAHGQGRPKLLQLRDTFLAFKAELELHMQKEERVLFPLCRRLDASAGQVDSYLGPIASPISVMVSEHDDAGKALATMRALMNNYVPEENACPTFRALLAGLAEMEADMHQHVHKENNILFPRAMERERAA